MSTDTPQLIIFLDGREVQTVALGEALLAIGRTPDNGLPLPHPLVARRHAEIRFAQGIAQITDLGGAAGTFVGDERLLPNQPRQLADGDLVRIGPFSLLFRGAARPQVPESELPAGAANATPAGAVVASVAPVADAGPRPTYPAPRAAGPESRYIRDLPVVYHTSEFLGRFLQIFESLWEPLEQRQDHVHMYFDPRTCPAAFLPWLARWIDLSLDPSWPEGRQRAMLTEAFELYRWRGTRYGLSRMIELSTGIAPEIVDEPSLPFVMRVRLSLPDGAAFDRQAVEDVINAHKPAHVGYILELHRST
jgi:phage tail-like protein